jgi:hypothetical protein
MTKQRNLDDSELENVAGAGEPNHHLTPSTRGQGGTPSEDEQPNRPIGGGGEQDDIDEIGGGGGTQTFG